MRPNPWPLPRIENVLETSSVIPTWRTRLGPSQLIQSSQDNQCTWHGRYLILILSFWCSFCCFCFSLFLGTDRSVKLTGRSTLVLNEHLWLNQQKSIIDEVLVTYKLETLVPGNYSSHLRSTVSFSGNVHHFLQVNFSLDEFDFLFQLFLSSWYAFSFSWCC